METNNRNRKPDPEFCNKAMVSFKTDALPTGKTGNNSQSFRPNRKDFKYHFESIEYRFLIETDNRGSVAYACGRVADQFKRVVVKCGEVVRKCGRVVHKCEDLVSECGRVVLKCGSVEHKCEDVVRECGSDVRKCGRVVHECGSVVQGCEGVVDECRDIMNGTTVQGCNGTKVQRYEGATVRG